LIFKRADAHNTPFKVIKCKNKAAKRKLKGLKNDTLDKRCGTSRLHTGKKTFRKPFNKNLSGTSGDALLVDSDNDYNKDELEIVDLQLLIENIAVSPATFDIGDGDNNYIYKLIKLKLPNKFRHILSYKY
jgi:hypothetical protein